MTDRARALDALAREITGCFACPRLVEWREKVAEEKRAAFEDEEYWGRPVPGFGDPAAWLLIVGLAPAAHGANRTGRIFTGDRSGDWLFRALHRAGIASQPESVGRRDGLELEGAWVSAAVRCAPPDNRPKPSERRNCRTYLERELDLLADVRVIVPLGGYAYRHVLRILRERGLPVPSPMPSFAHGLELTLARPEGERAAGDARRDGVGDAGPAAAGTAGGADGPEAWPWIADQVTLLASYHPSQQNTFTGVLTEEAFDGIWERGLEVRCAARPG